MSADFSVTSAAAMEAPSLSGVVGVVLAMRTAADALRSDTRSAAATTVTASVDEPPGMKTRKSKKHPGRKSTVPSNPNGLPQNPGQMTVSGAPGRNLTTVR